MLTDNFNIILKSIRSNWSSHAIRLRSHFLKLFRRNYYFSLGAIVVLLVMMLKLWDVYKKIELIDYVEKLLWGNK